MLSTMSRSQVRAVDAKAIHEYGLPGIVLMENAGRGAAELLARLTIGGRVVVCAGKGNNGGDGLVIARHLDLLGFETSVLLFCDPAQLSGDAAVNFGVATRANLDIQVAVPLPSSVDIEQRLAAADWIVDALLGTGTTGSIREPYATAIAAINRSDRRIFAVDLPSGLDCDTGQPLGDCVRASHTATFVARKIGFESSGAREFTGKVHVIDIGVPRNLLAEIAHGN